ncbi:hypothetical protein M5689_009839 [Euphorbia peplus]|nr:hypothetical protein M5689_009839 [Euphorbia peplus]
MASMISLPIVLNSHKTDSNLPLFTHKEVRNSLYGKNKCQITFLKKPLKIGRQKGLSLLVPWNAKKSSESEVGDEENKNNPALETVLKLYSAIKNKNIHEVSNTIGDECTCVSNFFSFFHFFQGKQQVLRFFNYVMEMLGKNIEFVVHPTLQDGMTVGVSWKLEWSKTHVALGKGFSFYICQTYQGKVLIRNVEMFMEPILHLEPFRMKLMGYLMFIMEICTCNFPKQNLIKALILLAIILLFLKPGLY